MKKVVLLAMLMLFISVNSSFAIIEIVTNYNLRLYGFIVSADGVAIKLKQADQKEIEILKTEIKEINDIQSEITFADGNKFKTNIIDITDKEIEFMTGGGSKKLSMNSILQINHLSRGSLISNYGMLGFSFLTPGGVNFILGRQFENVGIRGTLGLLFITEFYALQGNFLFNLSKSHSFEHNISVGAGMLSIPQSVETGYVGAFYDLNAGGFFLEVGFALASEVDTPQLMLQLGYVHRFVD